MLKLIVHDEEEYTDPSAPVGIVTNDNLEIQWSPKSKCAGLGIEALGEELGGLGATTASDIRHTIIEILDLSDGTIAGRSEPVPVGTTSFRYTAEDNLADHDQTYEHDLQIRVVQYGRHGRRRLIGVLNTEEA